MKNIIMFFGSCNHVDLHEVDNETWERVATIPPSGPLPAKYYDKNRSKVGSKTRIVYCYPTRFWLCSKCIEEEFNELQGNPS